ncbi:MAG: hypothetical protein HOP16_16160 [Acidobacteria bacterium]|nr:hypothetical protein [Acidobacteriota bacterium]
MPDYVQRPTFFEGQIVGGADLNLTLQYGRDADARHLRLQHTWGIVWGLELTGEDRTIDIGGTKRAYKEVTLASGVFVDGTGRASVVTEPMRVPEDEFRDAGVVVNDAATFYPVFITSGDSPEQVASGPLGDCTATAPSRINETYAFAFGRISELDNLDKQFDVDITDGPGGGSTTPWRVLVGFVQWDDRIEKFTDVRDRADGFERRYAGVRASEVVGAGGALALRSGDRGAPDGRALRITSGDKGVLEFGTQDASGAIKAAMTVDTDGNLTVTGKIVGALAGGVQVESGVATDGMLLPLPAGITNEQIDAGAVVVQTVVTPNIQRPAGLTAAQKWFPHFYECHVVNRRVRCRVRWILSTNTASVNDLPGVCDYVLMAFPRKTEGAS